MPLLATHPCTSPLILDLENDGVLTTSLSYPVHFDINGDGQQDRIGWTAWYSREAFLWLDLNRNQRVDSGSELFGDSMLLPSGEFAANGFEALAVYDQDLFGGNGDGVITPDDLIWQELRLWIDRNHNGISEAAEIAHLHREGVAAIELDHVEEDDYDGNLNLHRFQGRFVKRILGPLGPAMRYQEIHDVFFIVAESE